MRISITHLYKRSHFLRKALISSILFVWIVKICVFGTRSELADFHELVSVTVTPLRESLIAVLARERSKADMSSNMIHHIAKLGEGLRTGQALQYLVFAASILVHKLNLFETFFFVNFLGRLLSRLSFLMARCHNNLL